MDIGEHEKDYVVEPQTIPEIVPDEGYEEKTPAPELEPVVEEEVA